MTAKEIIAHRLHQQYISSSAAKTAGETVSRLCAMQGQDYAGAKWSIGLRTPGMTDAAVETAIARKEIVRISSLRGTIHFIAAADVHWINDLIKPRLVTGSASFYKSIGLTETLIAKCHDVFTRTLEGGRQLSRDELKAALEKKKIDTSGHRMNHFISRAGTDGIICFAPRRGKEFTYTLLNEWLPARQFQQGAGLDTLALRYFAGRGPATAADFAYWSGFTLTAAKAAITSAGSQLQRITTGNTDYWMHPPESTVAANSALYLLPGFDEYYTGYADRSLLGSEAVLKKLIPPNGILQPIIVASGKIEGCWKRTIKKDVLQLEATSFTPFTDAIKRAMVKRSKEFGAFMEMRVEWV